LAQTPVIRQVALGQANSFPNRPIARVCLLNASSLFVVFRFSVLGLSDDQAHH
jgi:hypothetical protein